MKQFDVISIGSALRDLMFYTDETCVIKNPVKDPIKIHLICVEYGAKIKSDDVHFGFGGGAANTAVNFAGLGLRTGIISAIGDDFDGQMIQQYLKSVSVDVRPIIKSKKHRTGLSFLLIDKNSGEHTAYVYYGAGNDFVLTAAPLKRYRTNWYYISGLNTASWKKSIKTIQDLEVVKNGKTRIAWNPGGTQLKAGYTALRPFLRNTSVLILNKDEATELVLTHADVIRAGSVKQMLKRLHSWGPEVVIITDGRHGTHAYDGAKEAYYFADTPQDIPVDTTGAGDCFGSSFVTGYIRYSGDVHKSLRLGNTCATKLVQAIGAQAGLTKWKDLPKQFR